MLVLTRRPGEAIMIGDGIVIKVIEVRGDQIRLGIEAPPEVTVHRSEVFAQIQAENLAAAKVPQTVGNLGALLRTRKYQQCNNEQDGVFGHQRVV